MNLARAVRISGDGGQEREALGKKKEGSRGQVEYLAELGKGAGAVDMALFRDFIVMELSRSALALARMSAIRPGRTEEPQESIQRLMKG